MGIVAKEDTQAIGEFGTPIPISWMTGSFWCDARHNFIDSRSSALPAAIYPRKGFQWSGRLIRDTRPTGLFALMGNELPEAHGSSPCMDQGKITGPQPTVNW